ncbi:hypothetical protein GCM10008967_39140 [Bacillus carboniphilus]|uniref:NodB homology domain-containing protein n=1 Tax=Bacillus carboniphilus TaxID=86663 RepID=A0ABN0WRF3_9BACI
MKKLKKAIVLLLLFFIMYVGVEPFKASANATTKTQKEIPVALVIENKLLSFEKEFPYIANKTTYAPIQTFAKSLGVSIEKKKEGEIQLKKGSKSLFFSASKQTVTFESGKSQLITFFKKDDTWFAPVRFIGEYFGYHVDSVFSNKHHIVRLTKDSKLSHVQYFASSEKELDKYYELIASLIKPKIYLTFDDGPTAALGSILDTLNDYDAKATFFMLEPYMREYPALVKQLVQDGHYPALHSVSHDKNKLYRSASPSAFINEMLQTQETLYQLTGEYSFLVRAPYGSKPYLNNQYLDALVWEGMKMWDWNIDPQDWKYEAKKPEMILENIKTQVEQREKSNEPMVILLHVRNGTAKVLPSIVEYLQNKGYELAPYHPNEHFQMNFWKDERL